MNVERLQRASQATRAASTALDALLERECSYRLAHWRVAGEEINYRRFFDINGLAAIRVEDPEVFEEAHALIFQLAGAEGKVHRPAHRPPGRPVRSRPPTSSRLQERVLPRPGARGSAGEHARRRARVARWWSEALSRALARGGARATRTSPLRQRALRGGGEDPGRPRAHPRRLGGARHHRLPLRQRGHRLVVFVREAEESLTETYEQLHRPARCDFEALLCEKKKLILAVCDVERDQRARPRAEPHLGDEPAHAATSRSTPCAARWWSSSPSSRSTGPTSTAARRSWTSATSHYIEWTIARAQASTTPPPTRRIFDFLQDVLLRRYPEHLDEAERRVMLRFAMKLQQLTGPVMAKGLEDTAFYLYNRLVSLNEVGGEPEHFGTRVAAFHLRNRERARALAGGAAHHLHPRHQAQRGRARAARRALRDARASGGAAVERWREAQRRPQDRRSRQARAVGATTSTSSTRPSSGAWPMGESAHGRELRRTSGAACREYMLKAIKEAKVHTSWTNPDAAYEEATAPLRGRASSTRSQSRAFLEEARQLQARGSSAPGSSTRWARWLLKLASPGVPDIYQGCELWDLSLVDPDNRRPVDFQRRAARCSSSWTASRRRTAVRALPGTLCGTSDGRPLQALPARRGAAAPAAPGPELFRARRLRPLDARRHTAARALAFARRHGDECGGDRRAPRWSRARSARALGAGLRFHATCGSPTTSPGGASGTSSPGGARVTAAGGGARPGAAVHRLPGGGPGGGGMTVPTAVWPGKP